MRTRELIYELLKNNDFKNLAEFRIKCGGDEIVGLRFRENYVELITREEEKEGRSVGK